MRTIFVFGSNLAGRHGKGAAKEARFVWGAEYGIGEGLTGSSYAIPTKDRNLQPLPLPCIAKSIERFAQFAKANKDLLFYLTPVGCGLAGYKQSEIAPLFKQACLPNNVVYAETWEKELP